MTCLVKSCKKTKVSGFRYCEEHLCSRVIKGSKRCQRRKFAKTPFCFLHQYSNKRIDIILGILGIVVAILILFYGQKMLNYVFGTIEIDFKDNDLLVKDGNTYAKIEILNLMGYPLLYVNGTVALECDGLMGHYVSGPFKLEGNYDFLANGAKSEFLLSQDTFLIDLIKTRDVGCSDVSFQFAGYKLINETHAKINNVDSFEVSGVGNDISIKKIVYNYTDSTEFYDCDRCQVTIGIYASNIKKPFYKKEYKSFIGSTKTHPFQSIIQKPSYIPPNVDEFFNSRIQFSLQFGPCKNMTGKDCTSFLCKKIREQNISAIYCDQYGGYMRTVSVPIFPLNYPEIFSQYPK